MNAVDGSDHYSKISDEPPPSLLTIILDTNPHAWALLAPTLPLSAALSSLFVFINAHLAFNNANKVAVIASHTQRAVFLYPERPTSSSAPTTNGASSRRDRHETRNGYGADSDIEMADGDEHEEDDEEHREAKKDTISPNKDANQYQPFRQIQDTILKNLQNLYKDTPPSSLAPTTSIAGALTLALTHINKSQIQHSSSTNLSKATAANPTDANSAQDSSKKSSLLARIFILSVSGDLAHQYIPIMNTIFACQRLAIPIDIAKVAGDTVFLQQASDATHGTYMKLEAPRGLLQYLMMGFLPDQTSRRYTVPPTAVGVDFRAACFCHRNVVDVGFVCSICLSIFCCPPEGALCLTCGTHLHLGDYGGKPAVIARKKKKKKNKADG